jgi:hypothetical protein
MLKHVVQPFTCSRVRMMKKQFSALNFNGPFGDVTHCQDQLTELCHYVLEMCRT